MEVPRRSRKGWFLRVLEEGFGRQPLQDTDFFLFNRDKILDANGQDYPAHHRAKPNPGLWAISMVKLLDEWRRIHGPDR